MLCDSFIISLGSSLLPISQMDAKNQLEDWYAPPIVPGDRELDNLKPTYAVSKHTLSDTLIVTRGSHRYYFKLYFDK